MLLLNILIPTLLFSQTVTTNSSSNVLIADSFRITLTNDSLSVSLQNRHLPVSDIQQFDAYLKAYHPDLSKSFVFVETPSDINYYRKKDLMNIFTKYHNQQFSGIIYKPK